MGGRKKLTPEDVEAQLDEGEWLTPGAVAVLLGVDRGTIVYWMERGKTPAPANLQLRFDADPINGYRTCHPDDVRAILAAKRREPSES